MPSPPPDASVPAAAAPVSAPRPAAPVDASVGASPSPAAGVSDASGLSGAPKDAHSARETPGAPAPTVDASEPTVGATHVPAPELAPGSASAPGPEPAPAPAPTDLKPEHGAIGATPAPPPPPPPPPAPAPGSAPAPGLSDPTASPAVNVPVVAPPPATTTAGSAHSHSPSVPTAADQSAWIYQTWGSHDMDGVAQAAAVAAAAAAAASGHVGGPHAHPHPQPVDLGGSQGATSEQRKRRPTDPSKRAEQNRVAQRNFRMRRDARFKLLQEQAAQLARLSQENIQMQGRWAELLSLANKFRTDNHALRVTIATLAQQSQTPTAREAIEAALRTVREKEAQAHAHVESQGGPSPPAPAPAGTNGGPSATGDPTHPSVPAPGASSDEAPSGTAEEGANQLMNLEGQPELPQLFGSALSASEQQPSPSGTSAPVPGGSHENPEGETNEALRNLMVAAMAAPRAEALGEPDESRKRKATSPPPDEREDSHRPRPPPESAQQEPATVEG